MGTGDFIEVITPNGHRYSFDIEKKPRYTRFCGRQYKTFIVEYGLNIGDKFVFDMDVCPEVVPIHPEGANGEPKYHLGVLHEENASMTANGIPVQLTDAQWSRKNAIMLAAGPVDSTYLHCLTESVVMHNYRRIPRAISEALNLGFSGDAILSIHGG